MRDLLESIWCKAFDGTCDPVYYTHDCNPLVYEDVRGLCLVDYTWHYTGGSWWSRLWRPHSGVQQLVIDEYSETRAEADALRLMHHWSYGGWNYHLKCVRRIPTSMPEILAFDTYIHKRRASWETR